MNIYDFYFSEIQLTVIVPMVLEFSKRALSNDDITLVTVASLYGTLCTNLSGI